MNQQKVLVFPSGTEIANEIINSLKNHKYYDLVLASSAVNDYSSFRSYPRYHLPHVDEQNFLMELNSLIDREGVSYVIPAHDDVAYCLSQLADDVNAHVIGQSAKVNEIVRFKDKTYDYFQGVLPLAKVFDKPPSESDFPVFAKPKRGQGSFDSVRLNDINEYDSFFATRLIDDYVVMECLIGNEFTIDCFSDQGGLLYSGARTRDRMTRGISVLSSLVVDAELNEEFRIYASKISSYLNMHGMWFFQMKFNKNNELCLLEIGPRVSGTMMLNRVLGVNFVELALLQQQGCAGLDLAYNNISLSLARALVPVYKHDISYDNLYIDFDDTLLLREKYINAELMKLIFETKNQNKNVYLITKNTKNNLAPILSQFGIANIFDAIYHLRVDEEKVDFMKSGSVLIDDSFIERRSAISAGHFAFSIDNFHVLFAN